MDTARLALAFTAGALVFALARAPVASGEEITPTRTVEYAAHCFIDNQGERRWCERHPFARPVDCTREEDKLGCRIQYMNAMGMEGWAFMREGDGRYDHWYDSTLYFYERVTVK